MFNSQKLIIFCLLFAVVLLQSLEAGSNGKEIDLNLSIAQPGSPNTHALLSPENVESVELLEQGIMCVAMKYWERVKLDRSQFEDWWQKLDSKTKLNLVQRHQACLKRIATDIMRVADMRLSKVCFCAHEVLDAVFRPTPVEVKIEEITEQWDA